jgi:hypothetical protein
MLDGGMSRAKGLFEESPLNNNRGNNRRRGRGNNRQQGGGQPSNRIDSRARGNAPQLLEKYRKLAHDAHLNGDRVTEEYYLQFADHYFRVTSDTRQRQEEARQQRQERWQDGDRYDNDGGEYGADSDYPAAPFYSERRERDEDREAAASAEPQPRGETAGEEHGGASSYEPAENPFIRENRAPRAAKPRRPRRDAAANGDAEAQPRQNDDGDDNGGTAASGINVAALPPSISSRDDQPDGEAKAEAKPKRRTRRKPPADDADEPLQAAS